MQVTFSRSSRKNFAYSPEMDFKSGRFREKIYWLTRLNLVYCMPHCFPFPRVEAYALVFWALKKVRMTSSGDLRKFTLCVYSVNFLSPFSD